MRSIYLKRGNPLKNIRRFYHVQVQPDLWGGVMLVREFGRIGQPGTVLKKWFQSEKRAINAMNKLVLKKMGKGYDH